MILKGVMDWLKMIKTFHNKFLTCISQSFFHILLINTLAEFSEFQRQIETKIVTWSSTEVSICITINMKNERMYCSIIPIKKGEKIVQSVLLCEKTCQQTSKKIFLGHNL